MDFQKKDGGVYEPALLTSFQQSIQRFNDSNSCKRHYILKDQKFA